MTKDAEHVSSEHYKLFTEQMSRDAKKGRKRVSPRAQQQLFLFTKELFSVPL